MLKLKVHSTLVDSEGRSPIILINGAANSAHVWRFWQEDLAARGWSSYALDLRGHGESEAIAVQIRSGVFGPEEYGIVHRDPDRQLMMPDLVRDEGLIALNALAMESRVARDERKGGITIEKLECLLLVVTGTADSNGRANGMRTCTSRGNTSRQRVHLTGGWC
jgi:alpha/beta hydrolase fold